VRLRILAWGSTLDAMSTNAGTKRFWLRPFQQDGEPLLNPRVVRARTQDGAVKKLVRWLQWEGYEIEGLSVHVEELQ
jgi:hypothetical protein